MKPGNFTLNCEFTELLHTWNKLEVKLRRRFILMISLHARISHQPRCHCQPSLSTEAFKPCIYLSSIH